jgi:hypothetical protein
MPEEDDLTYKRHEDFENSIKAVNKLKNFGRLYWSAEVYFSMESTHP